MRGYGWTPYFVEGSDPETMHQAMAATTGALHRRNPPLPPGSAHHGRRVTAALAHDRAALAQRLVRAEEVGGHRLEGSWRAHQVPLPDVKKNPEQLRLLENWMRSQKPEELFDSQRQDWLPALK
jgi:xylulose-5-phosphate/fructose-6-phosphate phosphoketolase